jgi:phage I-like protein
LISPFLLPVLLSTPAEGQAASSWNQIARVGAWWDPRYGDFELSREDLAQMLTNFKHVFPLAPTELPMDYNHGTSKPDTPEKGKAAGWFKDMQLRANGDELWALIEWTAPAAAMIANKEYRFVSPTFAYDYKHTNGQELGTTLLAAAITNTPVIEGQTPLGLTHPGARERTRQEIDMPKLITVKDVEGKDVKLSAETVAEMVKAAGVEGQQDLSKQIGDLKIVVDTQGKSIEAIKGENVELKKQNDALVQAAKTADATAKVEKLILAGKALPVEREGLIKLALSNADLFEDATKHRPVLVTLNTERGSGAPGDASLTGQLEAAIIEEQKLNPKLSREQASTRALTKNPKLYDESAAR